MAKEKINIFWDNSNIWLTGVSECQKREPNDTEGFRIHFSNLFNHVVQGREVSFAFLAGSIPPANDKLWDRFNQLGIQVERQERGRNSNGEVAVDEAIQLAMANRILDCDIPETIVLLTGDGSGFLDGKGFIKQLERAVKKNWKIEVWSWSVGCNRHLKEYAERNGTYHDLAEAYDKVTFIQEKRWATPVY